MPHTPSASSEAPLQLHGSARTVASVLARLPPVLATPLAARLFFVTPPRMKVRPEAAAGLAEATAAQVTVDGRAVRFWRWGSGPVVLLMHGWGGRAAQLWPLAEALLAAGLSPVALDAPGHGATGGLWTSIPAMSRALRAVAAEVGPIHAVLAHSLGGPVVSLALRRGLAVRRVVLLSPAAEPGAWLRAWIGHFARDAARAQRMIQRVEGWVGEPMSELHVVAHATGRREPLLVVHDRDDAEVPWQSGAAIAGVWPGAVLHSTAGQGHRTLLRDPSVLQAVTAFLSQDAWCACGAPALPSEDRCAQCAFEEELRDPAWRRVRAPWQPGSPAGPAATASLPAPR